MAFSLRFWFPRRSAPYVAFTIADKAEKSKRKTKKYEAMWAAGETGLRRVRLFDRDAFGEVAGGIGVQTAQGRDIERQQFKGDGREDRHE